MVAKVIVDIPNIQVNKPFDYDIPKHLEKDVERGCRVIVTFNHSQRTGIVFGFEKESKIETLLPIEAVDTTFLPLTDKQMTLISHLVAENTMTYHEAIEHVIPFYEHLTYDINVYKKSDKPLASFDPYFDHLGIWTLKTSEHHLLPKLKQLQSKGNVEIQKIIRHKYLPKPTVGYRKSGRHDERYDALLDQLKIHMIYNKKTLIDLGFTQSQVNTCIKHGLLNKETLFIQNTPSTHVPKPLPKEKNIWLEGQFQHIKEDLNGWIAYCQENGLSLLMVVPEIHLIDEIHQQLDEIPLIFDSKRTPKHKSRVIESLKRYPGIVLGTKSALFLPFQSLEAIIFFQSNTSSYQVSLGSYFDPFETAKHLYPTITHMYQQPIISTMLKHLHPLKRMHYHGYEPNIHVISMKDELASGNSSIISEYLEKRIEKQLKDNKKVLLLFQKKGYQGFQMCRLCGEVSRCESCHRVLTVTEDHHLFCNECGIKYPLKDTCSRGHQQYMKPMGVGLEYIIKQVKNMYPKQRIVQIDKDHMPDENFDIGIGTHSIKKYINHDAGLVGILLADMLWNHPSFDAYEHAFHLIYNIAVSEHNHPHETVIQTYDPAHTVMKHLYKPKTFMQDELKKRQLSMLPPLSKLYRVYIPSNEYLKAYKNALQIKDSLEHLNLQVIGPTKNMNDDAFVLTVKVIPKYQPMFNDWYVSNTLYVERILT